MLTPYSDSNMAREPDVVKNGGSLVEGQDTAQIQYAFATSQFKQGRNIGRRAQATAFKNAAA